VPTARAPFGAAYYPGTTERAKASIITITTGEHLTNLVIRAPALAKTIVLSGKVVLSDGSPVPDQYVDFHATDREYSENAITTASGSFSMKIVRGVPGELTGTIYLHNRKCRQTRGPDSDVPVTPPWPVAGNADQSGIVLTFECDPVR
jgi:hypothetical protein